MADASIQLEQLEISAVLIVRQGDERVLTVYNPNWYAFSLPMTKVREFIDPRGISHSKETWRHAASRAAAESLGRTLCPSPRQILNVAEWIETYGLDETLQQGQRDGMLKQYWFRVFLVNVPPDTEPAPGVTGEWLTTDELLDPDRQPFSPTVAELLNMLGAAADADGQSILEYCRIRAENDPGGPADAAV